MNATQRKVQAIGEMIIPMLGYFFFEWDLFFIGLFYLIDLFASEFFLQLKLSKIKRAQNIQWNKADNFRSRPLPSLLVGLTVVLFLGFINTYYKEMNVWEAFIQFLKYQEAGVPVPQGFILLPLVILANFQQYKLFFVRPQQSRYASASILVKKRLNVLLLIVAFLAFFSTIALFFHIHELIILLIFVFGKLIADLKL